MATKTKIQTLVRYGDGSHHEIFRPVPVSRIKALLEEHDDKKAAIKEIASFMGGDRYEEVLPCFLDAVQRVVVKDLFNEERALRALDAQSWRKVLGATDIYDIMPQKRRDLWNALTQEPYETEVRLKEGGTERQQLPPFTEEFVIPTIQQLLADRPQFLAEKVDGIFQALSQNHVTNSPWAFGKRMIIEHVFDPQWGSLDYRQGGHIHDLRNVVARIMGRGTLPYQNTSFVLGLVRRKHGEWFDIDGGSLRFRAYKKGTCHIEIHEDMAWRLNAILAILHPRAIPEENRRPRRSPKRRKKDVNLFSDVLPFEVLTVIQDIRERGASKDLRTYYFPYSWRQLDKHVKQAVLNALYAIGGVWEEDRFIRFGYDADTVLEAVISTGRLPNKKSYQWYPTPPEMAAEAVRQACVGDNHTCLEPSAGQGGIADFLPKDRTTCVEVSSLHAEILRRKGFQAFEADFLTWDNGGILYDRIVMNPPFSEGRWKEHVEHALTFLKEGGILVAVLPSSAKKDPAYQGAAWSQNMKFEGVSIEVALAKITKG